MDNRFLYTEGDVEIGDSQCSLCIHFKKEQSECDLIGVIPRDILLDDTTCQKFEYEDDEME